MHNDQQRLDGMSRNLANVSTVGYRRETFVSTSFAQVIQGAASSGIALTLGGLAYLIYAMLRPEKF